MESSGSFIDMSKHMITTFKAVAATGNGAAMAAALTTLAEISVEYDSNKVAKVRLLFNQLLTLLRDTRSESAADENRNQNVFDASVKEY